MPSSIANPVSPDTAVRGTFQTATGRGLILTKAAVKKLACPPGRAEVLYRDSQLSGFILRIYATGRRMWLVQYRDKGGATRRVNIGAVEAIDADDARKRAKELLGQAAAGQDPAARRHDKRGETRFGDLVAPYLAFAEQRQKSSTLHQARRNLVKYCGRLTALPVTAVTRAEIARLHDAITAESGPIQANRVLATLSALFSWAMRRGMVEANPASLIPKNAERPRERVLMDDEIRALWQATAGGGTYERLVRTILLTGCRRGEVGGMRWSETNGGDELTWTIPAARMKGALPHEVHLTALVRTQLPAKVDERDEVFGEAGKGFSGWSKGAARIAARMAEMGVGGSDEGFGLHDLRRTMSTRLHEAGVEPHVVETMLAHVGGHKAGVAGVYNKASYRAQKHQALERWSTMVAEIVGETNSVGGNPCG